jgi:hypothetical protein
MKQAIIPLDKSLKEGEILIYKKGKLYSVNIHELLPELVRMNERLEELDKKITNNKESIVSLAQIIKEK